MRRPKETFEQRAHHLIGRLLAALARRRDRAGKQAQRLNATGPRFELQRWVEIAKAYDQAYDAMHAAGVYLHHGGELVRRVLRDRQPP